MAKIYRVIQIKLNQFKKMSAYDHWLTNKAHVSTITVTNIYQSFYVHDGGKKTTGLDMKWNYVTITLYDFIGLYTLLQNDSLFYLCLLFH